MKLDQEIVKAIPQNLAQLMGTTGLSSNSAIQIDDETKKEMLAGMWPKGSIEADFAMPAPSNKTIAEFEPKFIQGTGYLLLPEPGTMTKGGAVNPPGDPYAKNSVLEQIPSSMNVACLKGMCKGKKNSVFFE